MKKLLAVLLALMLVLSAAAAEDDELSRLKSENEALKAENARLSALVEAYTDPSVIVAFSGGTVTFEEVYALYEDTMAFYKEIYEAAGIEYEEDFDDALELQRELAVNLADERIIGNYLSANDIELLDEADMQAIEAQAQADYEAMYAEMLAYYMEITDSEDEARASALSYLEENELDLDAFRASAESEAFSSRLFEYLVGDVTLTDDEVREAYLGLLASDKELYGEYPEEFAIDALYGGSAAWIPDGYRQVRLVVIPFDDDDMAAYDELFMAGNTDGPEADALFDRLEPEALSVYERLQGGESFDKIRAEYPDTEEYMAEFGGEDGFCVSAYSYLLNEECSNEVMALMTPGSVTRPLRCDWGFVIFEYMGEIEGGDVPFEQLEESIRAMALVEKQNVVYDERLAELRAEANTVYFFDRLN
ncbi:MAG: hypothetical protein II920_10710 [Clostridia bacterium]|nr:hypothetical protein [Clostridia bacterium]